MGPPAHKLAPSINEPTLQAAYNILTINCTGRSLNYVLLFI